MAVFNHTKHRELWNWLADNPGKLKEDWPGWDYIGPIAHNCFACESVKDLGGNCAAHCPLQWRSFHCCDDGVAYNKWWLLTAGLCDGMVKAEDMDTHKERIRDAALAIARLPLREIEGLEVI